MKLQVLDKGFVELMSHTPEGDLLVVNAAGARLTRKTKNSMKTKTKDLSTISRESVTIYLLGTLWLLYAFICLFL